jgi:hypothetical protein
VKTNAFLLSPIATNIADLFVGVEVSDTTGVE